MAIERLVEAVGDSLDPHPSDAAAVFVNVGDLRRVLRAIAASPDHDKGEACYPSIETCPDHGEQVYPSEAVDRG